MSDYMNFLIDDEELDNKQELGCWNILIVDDDVSVHEATKYALAGFTFLGRSVNWLDAYSAEDAKKIIRNNRDIAVMFLDVVMETDDAGLDFAKWFRENGINPSTRIIIRTGQPGQAPERQVILNYDLHGYQTKTEISSDRLFTTAVTALRAYRDINRLEITSDGLEGIIKVSSDLFQIQSVRDYAGSILAQAGSFLDIRLPGVICTQSKASGEWEVLAKSGELVRPFSEIFSLLSDCLKMPRDFNESEDYLARTLVDGKNTNYSIYLETKGLLNDIQAKLLLMFCSNAAIGLSNIRLYDTVTKSHNATVMSLARITEFRDQDTGEHIFRIARGTEMLAAELLERGLYPDEVDQRLVDIIGVSSTLHDIGKVATPDIVLLKPGKLTNEEFDVIKKHPAVGADILKAAIDFVGEEVEHLEMGMRIALGHHERWDGRGYPYNKKGREIPVEARITAVIDVFDALLNKRCYKPPFSLEEALKIINEESGTHFDPVIATVFLEIAESFVELEIKRDAIHEAGLEGLNV